jgi:hypothetical protein
VVRGPAPACPFRYADPQTGLFTTFWYDSRSTKFSIRQSRDAFDGKQIVLYSASLAAC